MLSAKFGKARSVSLGVLFGILPVSATFAQSALDETVSELEQWVDVERRTATESASWEVEKKGLQDLMALYRQELETLQESIREAEEDVSAAESARSDLNAEGERLKVIEDQVTEAITEAETALRKLHGVLPRPLQQEIQPLYSQIPEDPESTKMSSAQRIQFIVGVLTQIQKFNTAVTVVEDFREFGSGHQVQIDAVYFGLGTAYYVDKANENAGYAVLGADGWTWHDDGTLAPLVRQVVDVYGSPGKASFVELPVEIK